MMDSIFLQERLQEFQPALIGEIVQGTDIQENFDFVKPFSGIYRLDGTYKMKSGKKMPVYSNLMTKKFLFCIRIDNKGYHWQWYRSG